jgi:catechol 2,3-dioxygenase-like lactoylglutathione lyase family enzyme
VAYASVLPGAPVTDPEPVSELRLTITAEDYEAAVGFYRDALGLRELLSFTTPDGSGGGVILDAGRATLELMDEANAAYVDDVEVGRRVAGHVRVGLQVRDAAATTDVLAEAGAVVVAGPVETPWRSVNVRLEAPAGLQLTLFSELDDGDATA